MEAADDVIGETYRTAAGQWAFRVMRGGVEIAGGAGFAGPADAAGALAAILAQYGVE
jgi:hypothetical protein